MTGAILTGPEIQSMIQLSYIDISPFDLGRLNPNSYNVRLHKDLYVYVDGRDLAGEPEDRITDCLDMKADNPIEKIEIPDDGLVLRPGTLYLGRTIEHTTTNYPLVPMLEGRSSVGRLGLNVHITAGFGDVGFSGTWTLEMTCVHPLRIYPNVEIAQIYYLRTYGEKPESYSGKYQHEVEPRGSKLHQELKCTSP